jgi:hypothetical protein
LPTAASTANARALQAYAAVPGASRAANANAPAETGGGSLGYNEMLRNY